MILPINSILNPIFCPSRRECVAGIILSTATLLYLAMTTLSQFNLLQLLFFFYYFGFAM